MVTSAQHAELERNGLAPQIVANELKHEATRSGSSASDDGNGEVTLIVNRTEASEARHIVAEQSASDAFDRVGQARDGSVGAAVTADESRVASAHRDERRRTT